MQTEFAAAPAAQTASKIEAGPGGPLFYPANPAGSQSEPNILLILLFFFSIEDAEAGLLERFLLYHLE